MVTIDQATGNGTGNDELRPGLSTTAKITTAHQPNTLTIPIQALVQRYVDVEKGLAANNGKEPKVAADAPATPRSKTAPVQGVYTLAKEKGKLRAIFVPVTTGITGATDIEVLSGLKEGDEIVTGRYKVLRVLKSGTAVKVDNSVETTTASDSDK